jgi:Cdc6-like AAA superfamily ATPase
MATQVHLSADWDVPTQPPQRGQPQSGHYVGRERELALLTNELLRSPQRSILVAGYRGVGKTSLIYRALDEVEQRKSDRSFVFVLMNAAQLEAEADAEGNIEPKQIVVNLIRRLYKASRETGIKKPIKRQIDNLYRKAVAATFAEQHELAASGLVQARRESTVDVKLGADLSEQLTWALSWLVAGVLQVSRPLHIGFLNDLLPLLLVAPVPLSLSILRRRRKTDVSEETQRIKASQLYAFDNSIGNLEADLEDVHHALGRDRATAVYVIDELDKIDVQQVIDVLKFFKNLFTLSGAVFIFVGGEEIARRFEPVQPSDGSHADSEDAPEGVLYRPKEYTYFTSQYFLARPESQDLRKFLDEIMALSSEGESESRLLDSLKTLLIFEARGDFFDLLQRIRDRISAFDLNGNPIIGIDRFTEDEERRIGLQRFIDLLFDEKYRVRAASRWRENEQVLRGLYYQAHVLAASYVGQQVVDDGGSLIDSSAKRDLTTLLEREGALDVISTEEAEVRGRTVDVNTYVVRPRYALDVPDHLEVLSELERSYVSLANSAIERVVALHALVRETRGARVIPRVTFERDPAIALQELTTLGLDVEVLFKDVSQTHRDLQLRPPRTFTREEIEAHTSQAEGLDQAVTSNSVTVIASTIVGQVPGSRPASLPAEVGIFGERSEDLRDLLSSHIHVAVVRDGHERQIVVVDAPSMEVFDGHKSELGRDLSKYRVLALGMEETGSVPKGVVPVSLNLRNSRESAKRLTEAISWLEG